MRQRKSGSEGHAQHRRKKSRHFSPAPTMAMRSNSAALRASESMFSEMQKQQDLAAARRSRQAAQDEALAAELERRKREEESKRREIQRICEADPELRALQEKLKVSGMGPIGDHARLWRPYANDRTTRRGSPGLPSVSGRISSIPFIIMFCLRKSLEVRHHHGP